MIIPFAAAMTASCEPRTGEKAPFESYDSAGVRIVVSHTPLRGGDPVWEISEAPFLEVGVREGDDSYLLNNVMGSTLTSQGSLVVANAGDCTIRAFDQDGEALWTSGGCGEGPEEYQRILGILGERDRLYVHRYPQASLTILNTDGTFSGTAFPDIPDEFRFADPVGVFEDGSILMADRNRPDVELGPFQESYTVGRLTAEGNVDTLIILPYLNSVRHQSGFGDSEKPTKILSLEVHDDHVYFSWPEQYEINILSSGGDLETSIRRDWTPISVSEDYLEEMRDRVLRGEGGVSGDPGLLREIADGLVFSETHPAHHGLLVDRSGYIWVLRTNPRRFDNGRIPPRIFDETSSWDVFDPEGIWLGFVRTPPRFVLYEVGEDYLLGMWRDELEVEYVQLYGLARG